MLKEGKSGASDQLASAVALVTSSYGGKVNVMSAVWALRVSIDPFLMAVFVGHERETYRLIDGSGEFGISFCSEEQSELAHIAGNYSLKDVDKFSLANFHPFKARFIEAPLIGNSVSCFECRVIEKFDVGDHRGFIGEVLNAYYDDTKKPLIYNGGKFFKMGERIRHS